MPATNHTTGSPAPSPNVIARWAAGAKRWAAAVAAATYAVWVARLALGVYEAEMALAALLHAVRPRVVVWHGAQRMDARARITDAQASPVFMEACALGCAPPPWRPEAASSCSREPRAVTAPKRRAHCAAYGLRHSTVPTTAPAVPVDEAP